MPGIKSNELFYEIERLGYRHIYMSPNQYLWDKGHVAHIIDGDNYIIFSFNPEVQLWTLRPNPRSPALCNALGKKDNCLAFEDWATVCMTQSLGVPKGIDLQNV